jgi:hypothetical protein
MVSTVDPQMEIKLVYDPSLSDLEDQSSVWQQCVNKWARLSIILPLLQ